ncbi:Ig-like domain-containing protein [Paenibacillus sp.]|uniref:Ig-like domain-containing protein n=1 Tax=Paenibacillus sp. TaxID=58172 RepID=UPI002D518AD9|nr:Ig-like domain-containing protein [Paenibacillus sp.]HZG55154.1 Ig-like domain-containing protein [Paenibacillus sp.]
MSIVAMQRRWIIAVTLIMALLASFAPTAVGADVVTSLELEDAGDVHLYVDHETAQLKALATLQGVATKRDVTSTAFWATTSETVVRVDKGKLTPVGAGTAKVSARYEGKTVEVQVTVEYLYAAVRLDQDGPIAAELRDEPYTLKASAVEEDGDTFDVTTSAVWTSSDSGIARVDKGKVQLLKKGTVTITARYKGRSDSVVYTVTSPYKALTIETDDATDYDFVVGQEGVAFEATATLLSDATEDVTEEAVWTSSNNAVVSVEDGKLTFKAQGVADITASRFGHVAKASVVVRLPYQALLLTPSKPIHLFATDAPVLVKAEVANDFSSRTDVTNAAEWTTSNPLAATVQNGLIRPRGTGAAEITVSYKGLTKKIDVTVMPVVDGLHLDETEMKLFKGEVAALPDVYGKDLNGTEYSFSDIAEWTSSDEDVVAVEQGKLKAKKPGEATVTMKIRDETDTIEIQVLEKALALFPSTSAYTLVKGDAVALPTVKAVLEDGTELNVTDDIEWTTSSPNLLLSGETMKALLNSRVTLTGTYLNKKITIPVSIEDKMTNVVVEPTTLELNPKKSQTIKVTATDSTGKTVNVSKNVVWTSSAPTVATVSGATAKGVSEGNATLTATYQGQTLTVAVSVVPKLEKLALSEKSAKVTAGGTASFKVIAYFENGTTLDVTNEALWTSSDILVATVDDGKVTALKKGYASIKAKYQNKTVSARVTVAAP